MTLYLLDADVLIRAHEDHYSLDRIPQFWDWLAQQAQAGRVKVPLQIYNEVAPNRGPLPEWLRRSEIKEVMVLSEPTDIAKVQAVLAQGYAPDLTDLEITEIGRDPFLVAAALGGNDRIVVTREVSKPSKQRANKKLPDVCSALGVSSIRDFAFFRALDFNTRSLRA